MLAQTSFRRRYDEFVRGKAYRGFVSIRNFGRVRATHAYDKLSVVKHGATKIEQCTRKDGSSFFIEDDVETDSDTQLRLGQWEAAVQKEGKMREGRLILEHSTHAVREAYRDGIIPSYHCGSQGLIYVRGWDHWPVDYEPDTIYGPIAGCVELSAVIGKGRYCRCISLGLARGVEKNRESFIKNWRILVVDTRRYHVHAGRRPTFGPDQLHRYLPHNPSALMTVGGYSDVGIELILLGFTFPGPRETVWVKTRHKLQQQSTRARKLESGCPTKVGAALKRVATWSAAGGRRLTTACGRSTLLLALLLDRRSA